MTEFGAVLLGTVVAGYLGETVGLRETLWLGVALSFLAAVALALSPVRSGAAHPGDAGRGRGMSAEDVFDRIRPAAAEVARQAQFVRLVEDRIAPYAAVARRRRDSPRRSTTPRTTREGSATDTVAFLLALDTVNFGSGLFPASAQASRHVGLLHRRVVAEGALGADGPFTGRRAARAADRRLRRPLRPGGEPRTGAGADGALCAGAQRSRRVVGRTV